MGSLVAGFIVDSLTLQKIDAWRENVWIAGNLLLAGICIILLNRSRISVRRHFWLSNIIQFSFGALLGSIFVFYFRSAALAVSWPFILLLLAAMVGNELFQKRYERFAFQLSFFYFSLFSFLIFIVPILIRRLNSWVFLLSGVASIFLIYLFILGLNRFAGEKFLEEKTRIWYLVSAIFIGVNALYFAHLIPPIPLSLKDAGIYHSISKGFSGNYLVVDEVRGVERYFDWRPDIHIMPNESLYAYTSIYAPGSFNVSIVHEWQYKNEAGEWVTATKIPLFLEGGRVEGFRTYSSRPELTEGKWRVDVKTSSGHLIGRIGFEVVPVSEPVPLKTLIRR